MNVRRLVLMTEGHLDTLRAKTAIGLLRYCRDDVVCVLDSTHAGEELASLIGVGKGVPIVATAEEALATNPTALLIGIAPAGGVLPEEWHPTIFKFIAQGLDVISGLHEFLTKDKRFREASEKTGSHLIDVRCPPDRLTIGCGRALSHKGLRVLTVGTDECIGKMTAALEIKAEATAQGWDAKFIATGQTGILIEGSGIAIDAVVSDFIAGAVETMILQNQDRELLIIEGQGSIASLSFSGVTMGLLHGCMPQALVLCHDLTRTHIRGTTFPLPTMEAIIPVYENLVRMIAQCQTIAVCLNTGADTEQEALTTIDAIEREFGIPVTDPVRFGARKVVNALAALHVA